MSLTEALGGHLPQLPEEDIKAVRSFLPGKLLGRTAALLSLALLVFGFAGSVDLSLSRLLHADLSPWPWLHYGLLFGLPLLAVASQLFVEWRAARSRRALQRLAVRLGAQQSAYFKIGPYLDTAEDRKGFDRADKAHEKVLDWIERSASVPLYLTGDSGSGKSSLLNAWVLPALRDRGWTVLETRAWQDPEAALRNALARAPVPRSPRQERTQPLRALIQGWVRHSHANLLIVLDQFEEFVILGGPEQKRKFANLIGEFQATPVRGFCLLLVLRSDYQTFLDDMGLPPLRYGENLYQVGRFTIAAANYFLARSGLDLEPGAIDRLLTSAAELDETPGLVRPITLNVIGYVLAVGKTVAPSLDAGQLVRRYIEQTVGQPAIRDFAPRVLEQLVTEQATKRPRSEEEIAVSTHLRRGEVRAVLNGLAGAALARPLDPGQGIWELSHDFVARAVARYIGRRRRNLLQRGVSYTAPALLVAMLLVGTGVFAWNRLNQDRIRSDLVELGLTVAPIPAGIPGKLPGGLMVVATNSDIRDENLATIGPLLAKLGAVQGLSLSGTKIEHLEALRSLPDVLILSLSGTAVANLEPLKSLTALRILDATGTRVKDLEPLKTLSGLQSLNLYGTKVESLEPLKGLTALRLLDLRLTAIESLEPLRDLVGIETLSLGATDVESLEPLQNLSALRWLNLYRTRVQNLEPLKRLSRLQSLNMYGTRVAELEPLRGMTALQEIDLTGTNIETLEPLAALPALKWLHLSETVSEANLVRFNRYREENHLQPVAINQ